MKTKAICLVFLVVIGFTSAACGPGQAPSTTVAPSPTQTRPPTASPTPAIPTEPSLSPTPTLTPQPLTERLGTVTVSGSNELAGFYYRSFLQYPMGIAWGPDGFLYIADVTGHHIVRVAKDGSMDDLPFWKTVPALQVSGPAGVAFDSKGDLYTYNFSQIFRVDPDGNVVELPGIQGSPVGGIAFSPSDELYYTDRSPSGALRKWDPAGNSVTVVDNLPDATDLAFGLDGSLYLTRLNQNQILKIDVVTGTVSTFQERGCGNNFCYLAIDLEGDIWAFSINRLSQYSPQGDEIFFVVDGKHYPGGPYSWQVSAGVAFDDEGSLWVASTEPRLLRLTPLSTSQPDYPQFTMQTVYTGLQASGLIIGPGGEMYAPETNSQNLLRIWPDGKVDTLVNYKYLGNPAIAMDALGNIYLGLPSGTVVRYSNGFLSPLASLTTDQMAFGRDGALYAMVKLEDQSQKMSITRITSYETFSTFATQIDGISLGYGSTLISRDLDAGFYVYTADEHDLFFIDYDGQGHRIANLQDLVTGGGPTVMAASPVTGDLFFIPSGSNKLYRVDGAGESEVIAIGIFGSPRGMVVSPDGKWVYVAEIGAIDMIPIQDNPR